MDCLLLFQAIVYFCIFITGFVISIPAGVNRTNHKGQCMLYADVEQEDGGRFKIQYSSGRNCNFPIYYAVVAFIFFGLGKTLFYAYAMFKSIKNPETGSQMWVLPYMLLCLVNAIVCMVVAFMLSIGFYQFCRGILDLNGVTSCAQYENDDWKMITTGETYNSGPYYKLMTTSIVAAWIGFVLLLIQTGLFIVRFRLNRKKRSAPTISTIGKGSDRSKFAEVDPSA